MIRVSALAEAIVASESPGGESSRQLVRKVIPADNSCLFNSVAYCMEGRRMDMAGELRELVASVILSDPDEFSESVLSKSNAQYAEWILDKDSWGGAMECRILSDHYKTEIVAIDIQTLRPYRFGEDKAYGERIMLIYDGIHYDVLAEAAAGEGKEEFYATIFSVHDEDALSLGVGVAEACKRAGRFTDVPGMTGRCLVCGEGLAGARAMQAHAAATGHTNFSQA